jgi:hypothetical protein
LFLRFLLFIFVFIGFRISLAQDNLSLHPWQVDTLVVPENKLTSFKFPENHRIVDQSIQVFLNNRELEFPVEYRFNTDLNLLTFFSEITPTDSLVIRYQILPVLLQRHYSFFQLDTSFSALDSTDTVSFVKPVFENPFADFGGSLKRSGSIVRGVNIGSNKDMTLNSGLNLQLSGKLTEDLEIVAALTDEATPIQPEGNTQTLREIDKVFIKFNSPWVSGVLGDFNLQYGGSQFGSYARKLQGVSLNGKYKTFELGGTVASTRGFFNFIAFVGQEGNQGPYQLLGKNNEKAIIVLAGTERIWLNGKKLIRGKNNDYVIEYGNGQIIFTNRQLITSESRIEVDFEYYPAAQKYTRNVYSGVSTGKMFDNTFDFRISYYHEEDDPEKILESEGILSEEELQVIKTAGDDPLSASVGGATYVGDTLGYYVKIDTVVNDEDYTYYQYVGEGNGDYVVSFSSVGSGLGDYYREGLGIYRWIGIGRGDYLPIELLPLPSKQQLLDMQMGFQPFDKFRVNAEAATSYLDKNIISPINDKDNRGNAFSFSANLDQAELKPLNLSLGLLTFALNSKYIDQKFQPIDRLNQPDFVRYWNLLPDTKETNQEESVEFKTTYLPWSWLHLNGGVGKFKKVAFNSFRYNAEVLVDAQDWFKGSVSHELIKSAQISTNNEWLRQKADLKKDIGIFQPSVFVEREQRKNIELNRISGFAFDDLGARLSLINLPVLNGYLQYNQRKDDVFVPELRGRKLHQSTSWTKRLHLALSEWNSFSGYFDVSLRKKDYTEFFEKFQGDLLKEEYLRFALQDTTWQDRETNLIEFMLKNFQWNRSFDIQWQYRISVGQTALREKVYIEVQEGRGNFRYDEELEEYVPDPNGNYVLFIVPTGNFEPITQLGTSIRLLLDPRRALKKPQVVFTKLLAQISSDSYFRIEEESKDETLSNLYFLKYSTFQGPNTQKGSIVYNQDLWFMRQNRDHSFRLRYRYRDDLFNQFLDANDNENRLSIERSIWANYRIIEQLKAQSSVRNVLTFRNNPANEARNRDINSLILNQNFSYRPGASWEFGIESEYGQEEDLANQKNLKLDYGRALLRTSYAILRKGKISSTFNYQMVKVLDNPLGVSIPFEMAGGKKEGVSKSWQLRGEYTIAENVVISLFYNGRDDAGFDKIIHTGQAEIRAYF